MYITSFGFISANWMIVLMFLSALFPNWMPSGAIIRNPLSKGDVGGQWGHSLNFSPFHSKCCLLRAIKPPFN